MLAALARLSPKYQLDQLLGIVLRRMKDTFTAQLDVWDRRFDGFPGGSSLRLSRTDAIEALNLFRLLRRPEMIPVALYNCCQNKPKLLTRPFTRRDGVTREQLAPSDLELCLEVKEQLLRATVRLLTQMCEACNAWVLQLEASDGDRNPGPCSSPGNCSDGLRALLDNYYENLRDCVFPDPLDTYYGAMLDSLVHTGGICTACGYALQAEYSRLRKKVWESLPGLAGVEVVGWDSKSGST